MRLGTFVEYKGFVGTIEYSSEDKIHYGSIENTKDFVNYEANSIEELYKEFHKAIDDYLSLCISVGKDSDNKISNWMEIFNFRMEGYES